MKYPFFIIYFIIPFSLFSQKYEVFKDKNTKLFGLQDPISKNIKLLPAYNSLKLWKDTLFFAEIGHKKGVIDYNGEIIVPFKKDFILRNMGIYSPYYNELIESESFIKQFYFINNERKCIPHAYYPCPCKKEIDTLGVNKELLNLQVAEQLLCENNLTEALQYSFRIASKYKSNPSLYFWASEVIFNETKFNINLDVRPDLLRFMPLIEQKLNNCR